MTVGRPPANGRKAEAPLLAVETRHCEGCDADFAAGQAEDDHAYVLADASAAPSGCTTICGLTASSQKSITAAAWSMAPSAPIPVVRMPADERVKSTLRSHSWQCRWIVGLARKQSFARAAGHADQRLTPAR
jgi:hypothetical protein